jgi:ABC-type sugar transport system ATPase subunit
MTILTLEHITKRFGATLAVDDVSFRLASGEMLAILGPSGCGKSTLLRMIAGLIEPDAGQVYYDGIALADVPTRERGIGMVFQEGALIPHWESRRSVGFFLELRQRDHEVPERVRRISKITGIGIERLLARRPKQLSGGEQQRVSVARALTRDLRLLLFDEPFSNLDAKLRASARVELRRLLNEFPVTGAYVTHDQVEAMALADRIAIMRDGRFEQIGTYQQLHDSPISLFVATFVGTPPINLFEGAVEGHTWRGENFGGFRVRSDLPDGAPVTMGIRPHHVHPGPDGIDVKIVTSTPYLAERYQLVEVRRGSETWLMTAPLHLPLKPGDPAQCMIQAQEALYFDTRTGQRVG